MPAHKCYSASRSRGKACTLGGRVREGKAGSFGHGLGPKSLPLPRCTPPRQQGAQSAWPGGPSTKPSPAFLRPQPNKGGFSSGAAQGGRKEGCGWKIASEPKVGHLHESPIIAWVAQHGQFSSPHFPVSPRNSSTFQYCTASLSQHGRQRVVRAASGRGGGRAAERERTFPKPG